MDLGEWIPGLKLSPFITERVEYQTNVFQAPSRAQDDVISKTIPGFLIDYNAGPLTIGGGYRAEILRFFDLEGQDNEHHLAVGQIRLELPRLMALLRDDFVRTSDPPGTELTGRIESTTNTLAPEVEYKLTQRLSLGADYAWTRVNFERRVEQLDRNEHLFGGAISWKFLPKADVRLGYAHGTKKFDNDSERDVSRDLVLFGLRGDLTEKLSSTFRVGYESRDPDARGLQGYDGLIFGGDWVYRPTERTKLSLLTDRSAQESTFATSFFFISSTATVLVEQQFGAKLTGNLRLNAGENDYPKKETIGGRTKHRNDTLMGLGAGLDYDIQPWLRVGAEYSHSRRESNFPTFSYKDDKIAGKVTLQF